MIFYTCLAALACFGRCQLMPELGGVGWTGVQAMGMAFLIERG